MKITREELISQGCTEKRNPKGVSYFENVFCEIVAKVCTKCSKVNTILGFNKQKEGFRGRRAMCKVCQNESGRKRYESDPEKHREYFRKNRESNPEKIRDIRHRWLEANPGKSRIHTRKWRESNKEKMQEIRRKWSESNPEKVALKNRRRRARKLLLPDTLTMGEQASTLTYFNGGCVLTGSTDFHMDHVIPLNCGHGGTTYENMVPLRSDLNAVKSDRHIFEWFEDNHELLSLEKSKFYNLIVYLAEVNGMTTKEYRAYVDYCFDNPRSLDDLATEEDAV